MSAPDRFQPAHIRPSAEQIDIQTSTLATVLVQANAGAAKTTTLALRIGQALQDGVPANEILVLTFTDAACAAMRNALAKIGVSRTLATGMKIQTFDAFAATVLHSIEKGRVPLRRTPEDAAADVLDAVEECGLQVDTGFIERFLAISRKLKGTLAWDQQIWAGASVDEGLVDALDIELEMLDLFSTYEELRYPPHDGVDRPLFRCALDATYDLARLLANPEPTTFLDEMPAWPSRLSLLLVDEMHDLNLAMFTIMRSLLDSTPARFCGVGDYDQVIHTTAGAERRFMDRAVDLGERRVRTFALTSTHRFSRSLAFMASNLAGKPYSSVATHTTVVDHASYDSTIGGSGEALLLAKLEAWKALPGTQMAGTAILLRHAWQSVAVENALLASGFLYELRGFESYIMQPEVLLVRALLAIATDDFGQLGSKQTRAELVRAVVFFCQIRLDSHLSEDETPQERIDEAIRHVTADEASLRPFMEFQVLNKASPHLARRMHAAIDIARASMDEKRDATNGEPWFDRFLDALEIRPWVKQVFVERQRQADSLRYFDGLKRAAAALDGPKAFFASLGDLAADEQGVVGARGRAQKAALDRKLTLTVALIADVKGLEFEHVVLPYLEQGVFPAALALDPVEERNLFYVGITRARARLTLLGDADHASEFLKTMGIESGNLTDR